VRAVEVIGNRIFASDEVGVFEREDVMSSSPPPSSPYPTNVWNQEWQHVLAPSVYVLGITFTLEKRRALQILFCYCHRRRQPNLLRLPESYYRCL